MGVEGKSGSLRIPFGEDEGFAGGLVRLVISRRILEGSRGRDEGLVFCMFMRTEDLY